MTKSEKFDSSFRVLAIVSKAMSHPARITILKYLAEVKTCISGDISKEIPLSRTTVLQHLKELKKVGLIHGEVEGSKVNYCLCQKSIKKYKGLFAEFLGSLDVEVVCKNESNC
ncbi:MAG: HTH-type transcriptional regulator CmtR [Bacteroidetes bacterium ADurb.Bin408]|nr:MAG: HTH-type transcriptional regulator CmtR [Bacteroidetes bacterium ADurb.Bin408]